MGQRLPLTKAWEVLADIINNGDQLAGFDWPYAASREAGTGIKGRLGASEDRSLRTG